METDGRSVYEARVDAARVGLGLLCRGSAHRLEAGELAGITALKQVVDHQDADLPVARPLILPDQSERIPV